MNSEVVNFSNGLIDQLCEIGKLRTAERYAVTLNSFKRFLGEKEVFLENVDSTLMMGYEVYLKNVCVCPNTSSFYMRNLRAMYNRAVEQGLTEQRFPFKHVYTGVEKTVKRAVSIEVIRSLRSLDLSSYPVLDWARDMFLFSFYTRGMSFIDMAFLKKRDLKNGLLDYRRQKTGQRLFVKWEKPMQDIVDKYDTTGSLFLLPIIKDNGVAERRQYINSVHLLNRKLKKVGNLIGWPIPLTSYVARHAWASIARSKNVPIGTISEAMGHDSENTTRIYLASLDAAIIDHANSIILNSL
jgi:integrase